MKKVLMMAFNQDAVVTSSQDGVAECARSGSSMSDVKQARISVNPHLKMVAKVLPTVRKEEAILGMEDSKDKVKIAKKQVFPWLCKFNALCREAAGSRSYQRLDDLMSIYVRNVAEDVKNCYKKPIRASKLKTRMNDYMKLFHMLYSDVRRPLEFNFYLERMSDLLAMYLDMEIKASRRGKEYPRTISDRVTSVLFILLENSMSHILNAVIKAKFFIKKFNEICIPIIQRVLRDIPEELTDEQYIQYVMVFKKWKVLVGRKEERQEINRLAAARLVPPVGFADLYHDSDKYMGRLPKVARGRKDKFTLMLMQASGLSVKDTTEEYQNTSLTYEGSGKSLEDMELNEPLLTDELVAVYENDDPQSERRTANHLKEMWSGMDELNPNSLEQNVMADLFEEEFTAKLKKRMAAEEKQRLEKAARKAPKAKKAPKVEQKTPSIQHSSGVGCIHNSVPRCYGLVSAGPKTNSVMMKKGMTLYSNDIGESRQSVNKMEADSQSQDEIIVIDDDDDEEFSTPGVKIETNVKSEEQEINKREISQPPVLRAVVRPENIEQLALSENLNEVMELKNPEVQVSVDDSCLRELDQKVQEIQIIEEVGKVQGGESAVVEAMKEVAVAVDGSAAPLTDPTSSIEPDQSSPLDESKTTNELLLEEISKVTAAQDCVPQLWMDIDGNIQNQPFEDLFESDPTSGFMIYPDGTGDNHNWSFSHDFILGQYDDDLFMQYECGNTNAFADFYSEQDNIVFSEGDILSPPLLDMMRDDPMDLQATTQWGDLSMMVSYVEKSSSPEREQEEAPPQKEQDGPTVVFIDRRKGRRGKNKNKSKEKSPPSKVVEEIVEKKSKDKAVEDVSKKSKKGRRKRGHIEEEEEEAEPEPEPEPEPKKRKGRQRKTAEPPPVAKEAPPPSPPPQTNARKSRGSQSSSSAVTKKKAQSRKRAKK